MFYVTLMVITKQKPIADTQKGKRERRAYHWRKLSHPKARQKEEREKEIENSQKTMKKMTLSVITLNVNGSNFQAKFIE